MPKEEIDYSNTIFYKIYCKDETVKDLYVGHTTNFVQRKYAHKTSCNTDKHVNHNLKVYKYIRDNGGWNNWKMEIIGFNECYDHYEARKIEQNYFETLHATLNSIEPLPKPKPKPVSTLKEKGCKQIWTCNYCNTTCQTEKQFKTHKETKKHKYRQEFGKPFKKSVTETNKNSHISKQTFYCEKCDYKCFKKGDFNKHIDSKKHKAIKCYTDATKNSLHCECGKTYKHHSSFYRHKKRCVFVEKVEIETTDQDRHNSMLGDDMDFKKLFLEMVDKNKELQGMVTEMCKQIPQLSQPINNTTNNNTTNNINNQNFNINVFLNEDCKDALNMSDFIKSIEISLEDLQRINQQGQTIGMSNLLIDKLNNLDIFKRPVHCSDIKKETIYIKDSDKWEEETKDRPKLKNALDQITKKSIQSLPDTITEPTEYINTCEQILKNPREDKKIISSIAKNVKLH